jgi:hypothetical protein
MSITHRDALRNALCQAAISLIDAGTVYGSGRIVIFDAGNNAIATCAFAKPAFQTPVSGLAMANPIVQDPAPVAGATPVRYEAQDCNGNWVWRGSCGTTGDLGDIGTPIGAGLPVRVDNYFYRAPF